MTFEKPGFSPDAPPSSRKQVEYKGRFYEVLDLQVVSAQQIQPGDRAFITTKSGNRYLLRRSRSHGDRLFAYRESDGNSAGGELDDKMLTGPLASIGQSLRLGIKEPNAIWESTPVASIEIRKGIDTAIEESQVVNETLDSLGASLIDRVNGRRKDS